MIAMIGTLMRKVSSLLQRQLARIPHHANARAVTCHQRRPSWRRQTQTYRMAASTVMMMTSRRYQTHQVDRQSKRTDSQQLIRVHLRRVHQPLNGLKDDKDGNEQEEETIREAR